MQNRTRNQSVREYILKAADMREENIEITMYLYVYRYIGIVTSDWLDRRKQNVCSFQEDVC